MIDPNSGVSPEGNIEELSTYFYWDKQQDTSEFDQTELS